MSKIEDPSKKVSLYTDAFLIYTLRMKFQDSTQEQNLPRPST